MGHCVGAIASGISSRSDHFGTGITSVTDVTDVTDDDDDDDDDDDTVAVVIHTHLKYLWT